jgi:hypothetical protein
MAMNSERAIRHTLKRLSRQRVALVLQPGNVWVIENAVEDNEQTDAELKTSFMRGWVKPIVNAIPRGTLLPDGSLPSGNLFQGLAPLWQLTEGGWSVVNRSNWWAQFAILISLLSFTVSVFSLVLTFYLRLH